MLVERPSLVYPCKEGWTFFYVEVSCGPDLIIQATGLIFSAAVVVGNAIGDVLYALADPRIKLE
jgi:ABC-type dipeptide/oligopeptide/nickel transport system permease component